MAGIGYWQGIGLGGLMAFCCSAMAQGLSGGTDHKWDSHVDVEAKPGSKRTLGELDLFMPITQNEDTLFFTDLRGRFDSQSSNEGNLGIGMRRMLPSGWNLGTYGYWDRRRTTLGSVFKQGTLGIEALGRDWDFRVNGYVPLGNRINNLGTTGGGASTAAISGAAVQITTPGSTTSEERALGGYDAEVGWRVPLFDAENSKQLRLYGGGYWFGDSVLKVTGSRLRAEFAMTRMDGLWKGAELSLGAEAQKDDARGGQTFLSLRLRVPFGGGAERGQQLTVQERRMTAPIVRDVDIVSQARVSASTPTLVETATTTGGQAITVLSSGTTTTAAALNTALATAGANTVILSGTFNTNAQVNMAAGQTLIGAGSLAVKSASGSTATLTLPGATIAAATNSTLSALAMANNATLIGMTVTNTYSVGSGNAVTVQGLTGVTIRSSTLAVTGTNGAYALDAMTTTNALIAGNTITANPSAGVAIGIRTDSANNITITNNTIATTTTPGVKYTLTGNNFTVFAAGSTGNVAVGGTCIFVGGAPTGSAGFSTITCP